LSCNRLKSTILGTKRLRLPAFFAGYRLGDYPESGLKCMPWDFTRTEALLINAYDFTRPRFNKLVMNGWTPSKYLKTGKRPIIIDSGAYYFVRKSNMTVTPKEVFDLQRRSKADLAVILDHPFIPEANDKDKRIKRTLANTRVMLKEAQSADSSLELMPVIHGHNRKQLSDCLQGITRQVEKYGSGDLRRIGIGSIAPLAQRGNAAMAVELINIVRELCPQSHIHCFSMGSGLLMLLAFLAGADSVDSQSWMVSAAFKYAQLPGTHVVRLGPRDYKDVHSFKTAKKSFAERILKLAGDEGFFVCDWMRGVKMNCSQLSEALDYVDELVDHKSNENVHNRACHNLWVFNWEANQYRDSIARGGEITFVQSRIQGTRYEGALEKLKGLLGG